MKWLGVLAFFFMARMAFADPGVILFVNLNYSTQELEAAQKVAKEEGRDLEVIPPLSSFALPQKATPMRVQIEQLIHEVAPKTDDGDQENALWSAGTSGSAAMNYLNPTGSPAKVAQLKSLMDSYQTAYGQIVAMENKSPSILKQIVALEKNLQSQKQYVHTLIVSGHSDGSDMDGETSLSLKDAEMQSLTKLSPKLFSQAQRVVLLGCYSNNPMADERWSGQSYFRHASLIAGYGGRAALRTNPASAGYLYKVLHIADDLDRESALKKAALSANEVTTQLKSAAVAPNAAINYCGQYDNFTPAKSNTPCDEQWQVALLGYQQMVRDYFESPDQNPPRQVDGTPLRQFYNNLQDLCPADKLPPSFSRLSQEFDPSTAVEHTIRLIFWWQIQPRYATTFAPQIQKLQGLLNKEGIHVALPKIDGNLKRTDFLKEYAQIYKAILAKGTANDREGSALAQKISAEKDSASKKSWFGKLLGGNDAGETDSLQRRMQSLEKDQDALEQTAGALEQAYGPLYSLDNRIPLGWL